MAANNTNILTRTAPHSGFIRAIRYRSRNSPMKKRFRYPETAGSAMIRQLKRQGRRQGRNPVWVRQLCRESKAESFFKKRPVFCARALSLHNPPYQQYSQRNIPHRGGRDFIFAQLEYNIEVAALIGPVWTQPVQKEPLFPDGKHKGFLPESWHVPDFLKISWVIPWFLYTSSNQKSIFLVWLSCPLISKG